MTRNAYSTAQQLLHWATFGLFVVQLWTYPAIGRTHHAAHLGETVSENDLLLHNVHAISGGIILVFALTRLWLRHRAPVASPVYPWPVLATFARVVHLTLYATLVFLPITGVLKMYVLSAAGPVHIFLTRILYGLLVLHIAGALLHVAVWRDNLLARMGIKLPYQQRL